MRRRNTSIRSPELQKFERVSGQAMCSYAPPDFMRTSTTWWRTQALPPLLKISVRNTSSSLISSYKALTSIRGRILLWLSSNFMISPSACHCRNFCNVCNLPYVEDIHEPRPRDLEAFIDTIVVGEERGVSCARAASIHFPVLRYFSLFMGKMFDWPWESWGP